MPSDAYIIRHGVCVLGSIEMKTKQTYRGVKVKQSLPLICEGEQVKFILKYRGIVYTVNKVI